MKRRLKRWVKVVLALIIIIIIGVAVIICSVYPKVRSNNITEPEIEYGDILQVEIKETK